MDNNPVRTNGIALGQCPYDKKGADEQPAYNSSSDGARAEISLSRATSGA